MIVYSLVFGDAKPINGWKIQLDRRHGYIPYGQTHVHVSRRGLGGEYSWNIDGSRHDQGKFPLNEHAIKKAKKLAAKHLGVNPGILKLITQDSGGIYLSVTELAGDLRSNLVKTYIGVNHQVLIFYTKDRLVICVVDL